MSFDLKNFIFGGRTFCCFLPVRFGIITMSCLSVFLVGSLSLILWFEVAHTTTISQDERAALVAAGLVETLLLVASVLGFVGAVVRKQLFVMIYSYFLYVHFIANVVVAAYFLWVIDHASHADVVTACENGIKDPNAQDQCTGLLEFTKTIYIALASVVLLIELYGAIIATRYVRQLRNEKRVRLAMRSGAYRAEPKSQRYQSLSDECELYLQQQPRKPHGVPAFEPYVEHRPHSPAAVPSIAEESVTLHEEEHPSGMDTLRAHGPARRVDGSEEDGSEDVGLGRLTSP